MNFLKAGKKMFGTASEEGAAVVEFGQNRGTDEGFGTGTAVNLLCGLKADPGNWSRQCNYSELAY